MTTVARRFTSAVGGLGLIVALGGCQLGGTDAVAPQAVVPPSAAAVETATVDSEFTRDGTFQSHISARGLDGMDFVYTIYPTKATPRTNEWYPKGKKYFTFTFQAYDLAHGLRGAFASKRKVYLDSIKVTSATITSRGGATQHPYQLDAEAAKVTFDPEALTTRYGMLITSPKGSFELRNQALGEMSADTIGVNLTFQAIVYVQRAVGSSVYWQRGIEQTVPIRIFASKQPTRAADIPVDAN